MECYEARQFARGITVLRTLWPKYTFLRMFTGQYQAPEHTLSLVGQASCLSKMTGETSVPPKPWIRHPIWETDLVLFFPNTVTYSWHPPLIPPSTGEVLSPR